MALSCADICKLARQIAKCPPGYLTQSGQMFNLVMRDLVQHRDLRINIVSAPLVIQANSNGPFTLAPDFLRTYSLWYLQNGMPYEITPFTLAEFDAQVKQPQLSNYPYRYAVDTSPLSTQSPQLMYIYPMSNQQITATHRYFLQRAEITNPETDTTVPWFDDQDYLTHAVATNLMKITDDTRWPAYVQEGEKLLRKHLIMEGDKERLTARVGLDHRFFHGNRSLRPTKATD